MSQKDESCVEPAGGPILDPAATEESQSEKIVEKEVTKMRAQVGKVAPDFQATGYFEGGFKNYKLSDYRGKWVVLCFYPGDFTFV